MTPYIPLTLPPDVLDTACLVVGCGPDLNTCIEYDEDTQHFQLSRRRVATHTGPRSTRSKWWEDEYLHSAPRQGARCGRHLLRRPQSGDWEKDFALTQDVGRAFLEAFVPIVERRGSGMDRGRQGAHSSTGGSMREYKLVYDGGRSWPRDWA